MSPLNQVRLGKSCSFCTHRRRGSPGISRSPARAAKNPATAATVTVISRASKSMTTYLLIEA